MWLDCVCVCRHLEKQGPTKENKQVFKMRRKEKEKAFVCFVCQLEEKKLWRGDQFPEPWPFVYLCWACANNHTYILPLLCARPFSTGLITFWLQFRCSTLTKQYLIDTSSGLNNSHKTSGFLFLLTLLESAIEGKAAVDTATHNWPSVSCGTASRASKCLSMIRKGRQSEGSEARTGKSGEGNTWWKWGVCRDAGVEHH